MIESKLKFKCENEIKDSLKEHRWISERFD